MPASGVETRVVAWGLAANTFVIVVAQLFVIRWLDGRSRSRALGLVGLIIAVGENAFQASGGWWSGENPPKIGDWVVYRPSDGFSLVLCSREGNARILKDSSIRAVVADPDMVW